MPLRGWAVLLSLAAVAAWALWPAGPRAVASSDQDEELPAPPAAGSSFGYVGATSCAAAACHNANGPRGSAGSEYSTWVMTDRHRNAYLVLLDARSADIERRLHGAGHPAAQQDAVCLNCHVHPGIGSSADSRIGPQANPDLFNEGVSCESCHGPAEQWRSIHYLDGWRQKSVAEKMQYGMKPTKDLLVRARLCTECHVGSEKQEVNHDLIAAGHPRLNFEMGAFHANMPKHWDEALEKQDTPDLEARLWVIGQVASAKAAAELLASRAKDRQRWPEFAEFDCYSCHHDLVSPSWRQQREADSGPSPVGSLRWGSWYFALTEQALQIPGGGRESDTALAELRKVMNAHAKDQPGPDPGDAHTRAVAVAEQLQGWLDQNAGRLPSPVTDPLRRELAKERPAALDWDTAAQIYLALAALQNAESDLDPRGDYGRSRAILGRMVRALEFPQQGGVRYDSPREEGRQDRRQMFRSALADFQQSLSR